MKKVCAFVLVMVLFCFAASSAVAAPQEEAAAAQEAMIQETEEVLANIPPMPVPASDQEEDAIAAADEACELLREYYLSLGYTEVQTNGIAPQSEVDSETVRLAYLDINEADAEMKKKILAARNEIIYSTSWRADDGVGFTGNAEKKEFQILPKFSEVFPGWDYPSHE